MDYFPAHPFDFGSVFSLPLYSLNWTKPDFKNGFIILYSLQVSSIFLSSNQQVLPYPSFFLELFWICSTSP